ncbi:MAG: GAF domain-containing sensor histidine kinase, partial [Acidobacteria bacterium]|nr:GAF domain-containing sensor histidine kinase [Acidobacteriota bacterium]
MSSRQPDSTTGPPAAARPPAAPAREGPLLTLGRLRALAAVGALALILALEYVRHLVSPYLVSWKGLALMNTAVFVGVVFLLGAMFSIIARMQRRLERQNRELLALHAAALDIYRELALEAVLQKVVDQARQLVGARYGALSVINEHDQIDSFITAGIDAAQRARIGPPPQGRGLLGVALREGQRLRSSDIGSDPRSVGFPPNHPPMRSLVAVPIVCESLFRGNLYLAEKLGEETFSADDEETLARFATSAAITIDHAYLHRQQAALAVAEERLRIAHEMHDGLAQVLAYVNTKAQAVREFLRAGRSDEAARQLDQLAAAAREVYSDVRESIIGLRSAADADWRLVEALDEYVASWKGESGVACQLRVDRNLRFPPAVELQLLRIVQEALANVRKHAQARHVEVELQVRDHTLLLTVADDGVGFNPADLGRSEFPRFGLATMRERAESIGGKLAVGPPPTGGTLIKLELPVPVQQAAAAAATATP